MNSAWSWFLAKMIVLPSRSPPATFWPRVIRCASTLSTVSSLKSHLLTRLGFDAIRDFAVLAPLDRVPLLFFLLGEIVVLDPLALEFQRHRRPPSAERGTRP